MATDIVNALFGVTPESYQQAQQARMDAQALQYAKLDPFQQANYAIGRGASGLAGAIGGALGGQDPELQRISMRQQIAGQLDYNSDDSMKQGIVALNNAGDPAGAMQLQQILLSQQAKRAAIGKDEAAARASDAAATRDRTKPPPEKVQLARQVALLTGFDEGTPEYNTAFATSLKEQIDGKPAAANIKEVGVAKGTELAVFLDVNNDQQFTYGTDAAGKQVRVPFNGAVDRTTAKIDARAPGAPVKPKDWMDFTLNVLSKDPVMNRTSTILSDAPSAIEIIRSSTTNDISAAALPGALARLTGEGKNMSNQDVARFARTGGLDDRLAQDAVKFFAGTATSVKKDQAEKFATALYRGALIERRKKLVNESEQYGYLDSPNYKTALRQIDDQLSQFKLKTKGGVEKPDAKTLPPADQALLDKYPPKAK